MSFLIYEYLWLAVSAIIVFFSYYYWKWSPPFNYWSSRNIKGPKPLPFFGNTAPLLVKSNPELQMEWYKKFGKIFGIYHMEKPALIVGEPELVKEILVKHFHSFRKGSQNESLQTFFFKIMVCAREMMTGRNRKISSPIFTSGKLRKLYPLINKCCTDFLQDLEVKVGNQEEIDLKLLMSAYTMDVIARCGFSIHINIYKAPNNQFPTRATNIFNSFLWRKAILMILQSFPKFPIIRSLVMGESNTQFFVDFVAQVIKIRDNEKHNDFLQLLMDVVRSDEQIREDSEDKILAQSFLFFIAGFEPTAATLSYCAYELALHPEIQQKLFEETNEAFEENGEISYDVLSKLPYLDALISETLRKYPPVLRLKREAMEDVLLGDSGLKIEKGVVAEIPVYAMHHDPDNFLDPFSFKPERFLPENRSEIKPYTYLPFGAGPRNCIGMRFALLEAKLALAKLSQKFKFTRVANTDVPAIFIKGRSVLQTKQLIVKIEKR